MFGIDPLYLSMILIAVGLAIIFLELFVPSAGVLGITAAILLLSGVIIAFTVDFQTGAMTLIATLFAVPVLLALMVKVWPNTPIGRRILIGRMSAEDVLPRGEHYEREGLVGQLGVAKTKMLPSGMIMVDGQKYDAFSDGLPIEEGDTIKVVAIKGNRIVVTQYHGEVDDSADLPVKDNDLLSRPLEELGIDLDAIDQPLDD